MKATHVSNTALGQLRPPSMGDIQRNIDRTGWDKASAQNHQKLMAEVTKNAQRFVTMQQHLERQSSRSQPDKAQPVQTAQKTDRVTPAATPHQPALPKTSYEQARGRSVTETQRSAHSITHLPANVQKAMLRNQQRDDRTQARQQVLHGLTERGKSAMRALGDVVRGQPSLPRQDRPQRTSLQDLQAKVATQKRVEKHAERTPTVFDKYMSKQPPKQMEQQRTKEQSRDRERSR